MKPRVLSLKNIGPFVGKHTIDFTSLGSIFLVCGKTGAGKTTLFDSISYAFYGRPLGSRASIPKNLRSQYVEEDVPAEVELVFQLGLEQYRIKRILPYLKKGQKNEKPEEVSLERKKDEVWENISCSKKSDTDLAIINLIKLKDKEFSRIVVLPQGEFSNFLKAKSNEKKETLIKLFPVLFYSKIMAKAKEEATLLKNEVTLLERELLTLSNTFSIFTYKEKKEEMATETGDYKERYERTLDAYNKKSLSLEQEKLLSEKRQEYTLVLSELEESKILEPKMNKYESRIERAYKAAPLQVEVKQIHSLYRDIQNTKEELVKKREQEELIQKTLEGLREKEGHIAQLTKERDSLPIIKDNLRRALSLQQDIIDKTEQKNAIEKILKEDKNKLKEVLDSENALINQIKELQNEIDLLDERNKIHAQIKEEKEYYQQVYELVKKRDAIQSHFATHTNAAKELLQQIETALHDQKISKESFAQLEKEKRAIEKKEQSALLAQGLQEGSPCPVCGSLHHPNLAIPLEKSLFSLDEQITSAERNIGRIQKDLDSLQKSHVERTSSAHNYEKQIDDIATDLKTIHARFSSCSEFDDFPSLNDIEIKLNGTLESLQKASDELMKSKRDSNTKKELKSKQAFLTTEKDAFLSTIEEKERSLSGIKSALKLLQEQHKQVLEGISTSLQGEDDEETLENCEQRFTALSHLINEHETHLSEEENKKTEIVTELRSLKTLILSLETQVEKKENSVRTDYQKAGFASSDDLYNALLSKEDIALLEKEKKEFTERQIANTQKAESLKKELIGRQEFDIESLEEEVFTIREKLDEIKAYQEKLNAEKLQLETFYQQYQGLTEAIEKKRLESTTLINLSDELNGANSKKLQFDTWILSSFLHEITNYANERLEKISEGRYRLMVSNEQGTGNAYTGLDLEIADAYTGLRRPSISLSGGEMFIASLSLALGLADSIQSRMGGIILDSMFIDEGFGSLDEASLENAIAILDEIRGNRMVGIISHVSELRTRIPRKIEIKKTNVGSKIIQETEYDS